MKALGECVLGRLAGLDEMVFGPIPLGPCTHRFTCQFRAIVCANLLRLPETGDRLAEHGGEAFDTGSVYDQAKCRRARAVAPPVRSASVSGGKPSSSVQGGTIP